MGVRGERERVRGEERWWARRKKRTKTFIWSKKTMQLHCNVLEDDHVRGLSSVSWKEVVGCSWSICDALCTQTGRVFLLSWLPWGLTQGFRKYWLNHANWLKEYVFSCSKQIAISLVCSTDLREDRTAMWCLGLEGGECLIIPHVFFYP